MIKVMEFLQAHGDTLVILVLLGSLAWNLSARITGLEGSISIMEAKLASLQRELSESKESAQRNFERLYDLVRNGKKD